MFPCPTEAWTLDKITWNLDPTIEDDYNPELSLTLDALIASEFLSN